MLQPKHRDFAAFYLVPLLCGGLAGQVWGDENSDIFDLPLEELMQIQITSATKAPLALRDIAASVTLITREDIARYGYLSLEELLMNVPGFYHVDNFEDYLLGVRGTTGGSIAFLINGVQQHPTRIKGLSIPDRSRMNIPLQSIDRIEIIRGPAAVIYGNNAFSGSINIVTNGQGGSSEILALGAGDNNRQQAFLRSGVKGDDFSARLNLGSEQNDGIGGKFSNLMSAEQLADMDPAMRDDLHGSLQQRNLNAELNGHYKELEFNLRYSQMQYGFYAISPSFHDGNDLHLNSWLGNLGFVHQLNNAWQSHTSLTLSHEHYQFTPDFVFDDISGYQRQGARRMEAEQSFNYKADNKFSLVAGINYRQLFAVRNRAYFPDVGFDVDAQSEDVSSMGIFSDVKYSLNNNWDMVAGYRLSQISQYHVVKHLSPADVTYEYPQRTDHVYRTALIYHYDEQNQLKIMYANALQDNSAVELNEPEETTAAEINYLYVQGAQTFSLSVFNHEVEYLKRRTVRLVGSDLVAEVDNSGEWQNRGVELMYGYRPDRHLTAELSGTSQRTLDIAADNVAVGNSPAHLFKGKLSYAWADWSSSATLAYVSEMKADYSVAEADNSVTRLGDNVPAYWLLGANMRYQQNKQPWFLNLHIYNLTDTIVRYPANELVDFEQGATGRRREVLFSAGLEF
ncbi:MAG: TonB-dependent receptor [Oceanospirillaceae bacterium]|nr:TonB-dependent receptor [Oceanospirillaceae bacterium]